MKIKLELPQPSRSDPDIAANKYCREIERKLPCLWAATHSPDNLRNAWVHIRPVRDEYNRARGSGFGTQLVWRANRVDRKVLEIMDRNPADWNNYKRAQQFRWLEEWLGEFKSEWFRRQQPPQPAANVVPFRRQLNP